MAFSTDMKGNKIDNIDGKNWYHGSPYKLDVLEQGSSITRNRELAVAFSHKPSSLGVEDDGSITHNGTLDGYLYIVAEDLSDNDIFVHKACLEEDPWEWLIARDLRLKLVEVLKVNN